MSGRAFDEIELPQQIERERPVAPTREEIGKIESAEELWELISEISDAEISIKTQLEFYTDDDTVMRSRRVNALIYWRQAGKNAKNRINLLTAAKKRDAA